jgi:isopenicillin N synthase-like dioxygenase
MIKVPVIDLMPARCGRVQERRRIAEQIDHACREIGFFSITGHGVPESIVDDLRRLAHAFFALPSAQKLAASHPVKGTNRGYHPVGGETLSAANDEAAPPDLKEFFHVGPVDVTDDPYYTSALGQPYFPPNIWPTTPAGFESAATVYYRSMSQLNRLLMRLAALALGVDEDFFDDKIDRSISGSMSQPRPPISW